MVTLDFTRHVEGIKPLLKPDAYDPMNWVHRDATWPRTLRAWVELLGTLRTPLFPGSQLPLIAATSNSSNGIPDVLSGRCTAADQLEAFFYRNQAVRFQMRRLFLAWAVRKMGRRIVGETDVGTLEVIPARAVVRVCDWRSRAVYHFHYQTIYRQLVGSLRYETMALSSPKAPKNPYTNLPWSVGQLLVLYDQVHCLLWSQARQFLDPAAQAFYRARLCLSQFRTTFQFQLDIDCAHQFFHDPTSDYWDDIYGETLQDLLDVLAAEQAQLLWNLVMDRSLPKSLLTAWDTLLYGFWCFENLNRMVLPGVISHYDLMERARHLTAVSLTYARKRKIARKKNTDPIIEGNGDIQ